MCVSMSRTVREASGSETAPSGRVPLAGAAGSAMAPSRKLVAGGDEAGCEVENTFDDVKRDCVVGSRFADAGREDKAKNSGARFLVGTHGAEQRRRRNARPGRQWSEAANQRDDAGNIVRARQTEFVPEESSSDHAPGYRFTVLVTAVFRHAFKGVGEGEIGRANVLTPVTL